MIGQETIGIGQFYRTHNFEVFMVNECAYCGSQTPGQHECEAIRAELELMIKLRQEAINARQNGKGFTYPGGGQQESAAPVQESVQQSNTKGENE